MKERTGAGIFGQSMRRRLSFPPGRYTTVFQAEIYAILACAYEIQFQNRPEKYICICSDSQAALKALQAARTSPLVHQCQKVLNISARHMVGLYWVPGHAEYKEMRSLMSSQEAALLWNFLDSSRPWESLHNKENTQSLVN